MGKIVISTNAALDGVVQDPDGQEGFERGGWFHQFAGAKDLEEWVANETREAQDAEALLLGRRSFEWFASRAPVMAERVSREWADRMDSLPKYVVSSTPDIPPWSNTTVLGRDVEEEISALKRRCDGDILVYGSYQLARALMARSLADELRLVVFPIVLGAGRRLFDGMSDKKPLHLVDTRRIGDGLVHHTYAFAPAGMGATS
ncbi:dihydrofolate reductase family protein [Scleromatobacter humisilvae]|uniref:Dihydrofolate reductase family protein n=1 Tax=Scleromatobacter humisilvae TaxID=2897159 RepID=A0A9X1YEG3_9BURK|nr:dihydrofolate reductase family protein [Scleromatobacter humisilvae]MCK9684386.1 dihydrofolate reductase family protein [Scleromatobacter humisilvae]